MKNVRIKSASILKEQFLKGSYTEVMGKAGEQSHTFNATVPVHPDLRRAFNALAPHVVTLADLWDAKGPIALEKIKVFGFSIAGEEAQEGVVISATRELDNLKEVVINTPLQQWEDNITPYPMASELSLAIEACKAEVYSYLFEDKAQADVQLDMFATAEGHHKDGVDKLEF